MTLRRLLWVVPVVLLLLAAAYSAWLAWQLKSDLEAAESSAQTFRSALEVGDRAAREESLQELTEHAEDARSRAEGTWWSGLTHAPVLGDDAAGIQALSRSLDLIAQEAAAPLGDAVDSLGSLSHDGRIDLDQVSALREPVGDAHDALARADDDLSAHDSSGYVDLLRTRYDEASSLVADLRSGLASAQTAIEVLPPMAGADGPRDYLLIFQNNAEIRAAGGMPGSWALLHAEDGRIALTQQGTAGDFPMASKPVLPLTDEEVAVYGRELGTYFQDPGFTPDFPRAAELWRAHWDRRFPSTPIDGVIALDPVALSYLLDGTGPVAVGDVTLTRENAVEELLNRPYIEEDPVAQDAFFAQASNAIFDAATGSVASPTAFVEGLNRAADERRLLIASFDRQVSTRLSDTRVEGALSGDDGETPHVDIGLNDLTGSKMSYYLRYSADVDAVRCENGAQDLTGTLTLNQVISPSVAARLPASVTGGGFYGTDPGSQYVMVRLYGPYGGALDQVKLNGRALKDVQVRQLDGRPVANVDVLLSSRKDAVLTWHNQTGKDQTGDVRLDITPNVSPGSDARAVPSAC